MHFYVFPGRALSPDHVKMQGWGRPFWVILTFWGTVITHANQKNRCFVCIYTWFGPPPPNRDCIFTWFSIDATFLYAFLRMRHAPPFTGLAFLRIILNARTESMHFYVASCSALYRHCIFTCFFFATHVFHAFLRRLTSTPPSPRTPAG